MIKPLLTLRGLVVISLVILGWILWDSINIVAHEIYFPYLSRSGVIHENKFIDNNTSDKAYTPLEAGFFYVGKHDDESDYYRFDMDTDGEIAVDLLSAHSTSVKEQQIQLQLYYINAIEINRVREAKKAPYDITYNGKPGPYFVRVFTAGCCFDSTKTYTLSVSYPPTKTPTPTNTPTPTPTYTPTPTLTSTPTSTPVIIDDFEDGIAGWFAAGKDWKPNEVATDVVLDSDAAVGQGALSCAFDFKLTDLPDPRATCYLTTLPLQDWTGHQRLEFQAKSVTTATVELRAFIALATRTDSCWNELGDFRTLGPTYRTYNFNLDRKLYKTCENNIAYDQSLLGKEQVTRLHLIFTTTAKPAGKVLVDDIRLVGSIAAHPIYVGEELTPGYDMGVNTSEGLTEWVEDMTGHMCMAYPSGQQWGAVFITFGAPKDPPRPGRDLSNYPTLSFELQGKTGGERVWVGIKDNTDLDNGRETKIQISNLTTDWQTFTFPLTDFKTADPSRLYVVTEFVFEPGTPAETVCFRNIQYLPPAE